MLRLTSISCLALLLAPLLPAQNGIRNFRAVDVSSAELRVTVEYTLSSAGNQGDVFIHATPEEKGGVFDPRTVDFEKLRAQPGTHRVELKIVRNRQAPDFTSEAVRVCLSTNDQALLCQNFPHVKRWTSAAAPPAPPVNPPKPQPPPSPPPEAQGSCSIAGQLSGKLEGRVAPDHKGAAGTKVVLQRVAALPEGAKKPLFADIQGQGQGQRYLFTGLKAGVVYRVFLPGFRSDPQFKDISCRANRVHHADFKILGPKQEG
jgi:hypothetical protein